MQVTGNRIKLALLGVAPGDVEITDNPKISVLFSAVLHEQPILRRQAAKIMHGFIRDVLNIPDITDEKVLQQAKELKDLLDCRTCVGDIMQVYCRGIMDARYIFQESGMKLFGGAEVLTEEELGQIIQWVKRNG